MAAPTPAVETADYVIVGAGSAGAALAARLTERPGATVLLLEAGPAGRSQSVSVPAAFSKLFKSERDWDYSTTPQPALEDRSIYWPRGKMLGGSSSMNAMMWVRGFAADYDGWAQSCGADWSYEALLPFFRRAERVEGATDPDHGTTGAVSVQAQRDPRPHTAAFLAAAAEAGYTADPANTRVPLGFTQTMVTQRRGARSSTAAAYLAPARRRPALRIRTGAHATRILFEGTRAVGVVYDTPQGERTARASREIVLCGGAVNTPQLLMLSGIGDPDHLADHGIDTVAAAPAVGRNLQDHLVAFLVAEVDRGTLLDATRPAALASYLLGRKGMLTSNIAEAYGFVRTGSPHDAIRVGSPGGSGEAGGLADVELIFAPAAYVDEGLAGIPAHAVTLGAILLQPESSGTITLASADPHAKPLIDPRYLSDPAGHDLQTILAGLAACEQILSSPSLKALTTGRFLRPAEGETMTSDARDLVAVTRHAHTLYHPVGTARMGDDDQSVVDPELRVRGVTGLRVADASIMPRIIRGHTNAPSIVIGEKAAELLSRR